MKTGGEGGPALRRLLRKNGPWVLLCALLLGVLLFAAARWLIPPRYEARLLFYVSAGESMSSDALKAARDLADSGAVLARSDRVVKALLERSGLPLSMSELRGRLYAEAVNGTELLEIRVQAPSPEQARQLAAACAKALPAEFARIVPGASLEIVDAAETAEKVFPGEARFAAFGFCLGLLLSVSWIVLRQRIREDKQ